MERPSVPTQTTTAKTDAPSSRDRLIDAVIATWSQQGHAAISARGLAQATALPTSSIYHHFGNLDGLLLEAQATATEAARRWCAEQLDLIGQAPGGAPEAFPGLFAALIDDWATQQRALGFAWRECHLLSERDQRYCPPMEEWRTLWIGFWEEICDRCGLTGAGESCALVFDGESLLHMMRWRRPVDRACLDEFARGWTRWLMGSLAPEGPWRQFAREDAQASRPLLPEPDGVAAQVAAAAADVMEEAGVTGLTHRAVAERAGLTLGTVAYHYRTSADLIRGTFEMLYTRVVANTDFSPVSAGGLPPSHPMETQPNTAPLILAMEELIVAVARDPAYSAFAPQLRFLRGRSSGRILQAALGSEHAVSPLDAALYSAFLSGQGRANSGMNEAAFSAMIRRTTEPLIARLKAGGGA
ncbi:MAG TPA: TetR/AcrR family transcriptional regulator [Sphingobium sp.]